MKISEKGCAGLFYVYPFEEVNTDFSVAMQEFFESQ